MSYTILLVEDNPHIMEINFEALVMEDYTVLKATDGRECMAALQDNDVDLIVLDIMLPDADGVTLCRKIKLQYDIPILFLSALGENAQIIEGLRAGGDDYLPKPYDLGVLLARIEARLRAARAKKRFVTYGALRMDTVAMLAYWQERDLLLAQKEFILLMMLARSAGRTVSKEALTQAIWGPSPRQDHGDIYSLVSRLNKKLEAEGTNLRAASRRTEGYTLEDI